MHQIKDTIIATEVKGLTITKLSEESSAETLLIALEKGTKFPEHTSPRNALLVVLEGEIQFILKKKSYHIQTHQLFQFAAHEKHEVIAKEDSKFLIIR